MLSSGANVIIWVEILSSGMQFYHLGWNVIIWDTMLSSGANVIIWDKMLSSEAKVIMVSSGANVIIWCYHVMLSSGMITPPFFCFSWKLHSLIYKVNVFHSNQVLIKSQICSSMPEAGDKQGLKRKCLFYFRDNDEILRGIATRNSRVKSIASV